MSSEEAKLRLRIVLRNVDVELEVPPGITALVGPSGSGKSTILGAVAGLLRPREGRVALGNEVWFDGATGVSLPPHLRHVAYVFQSLALFPHMTALANAEYGVARDVPAAQRSERAKASLERFRVGHLAHRKPATYSGGEAQRVALARALAMEPRVILLDEPFSALDQDLRRGFTDELLRIAEERPVPILHVTHDEGEARILARQVVRMAAGRVVVKGPAASVLPGLLLGLVTLATLMGPGTPAWAGDTTYVYVPDGGRPTYVNDLASVPPAYRASARPVDLSHVSLNEGLGKDLRQRTDDDHAALKEAEARAAAAADGGTPCPSAIGTLVAEAKIAAEGEGANDGPVYQRLARRYPYFAVTLALLVALVVATPWAARRMPEGRWGKILSWSVPLLVALSVIAHVITTGTRVARWSREAQGRGARPDCDGASSSLAR